MFSQELVEQIYQELVKQPYTQVAPLIAKMQNEAAHQPQATPPQATPPQAEGK